MGRAATGSPRWNPKLGCWEARVTVNGKRDPVAIARVPACAVTPSKPPPRCVCPSCSKARSAAKVISDKYRQAGCVPVDTAETSNEWYRQRYLPQHAAVGNKIVGHEGSWDKYVAPFIGTKPLALVTFEDIEAVRDNLTKLRLDGVIGAKRAFNVWSDQIRTPLSRAFGRDPKYKSAWVGPAASNPSSGVTPPVSSEDKQEDERERQPLPPGDFLLLMSCEALTVAWRRECAIKAFTGLRPAEFYGLKWPDVRLDASPPMIKVLRGRNMKTGALIGLKTKHARRDVPIHDHLLPLLRAMRDEATDKTGFVMAIPDGRVREVEKNVALVRANLEVAGFTAPELLEGNDAQMAFYDRSWRTTFATWCSPYDSAWVDNWLGHKPQSTAAKHYDKSTPHFNDATVRAAAPGIVPTFPELPAGLLRPIGGELRYWSGAPNDSATLQCEGRDLKRQAQRLETSEEIVGAITTKGPVSRPLVMEEPARKTAAGEPPKATVADAIEPAESTPRNDPDDALRLAIRAALDAGDYDRVKALVGVLESSPRPAPVLTLASKRTPR